jgi:AhpD family alkylhydroperoxidase
MSSLNLLDDFLKKREEQNKIVLNNADRIIKRIYSLDALAYSDGALPGRTKELLGLTSSLVLRCDDCIAWHVYQCAELRIPTAEMVEAMGIAMLVGGTITVPHVRKALTLWDSLITDGSGEN